MWDDTVKIFRKQRIQFQQKSDQRGTKPLPKNEFFIQHPITVVELFGLSRQTHRLEKQTINNELQFFAFVGCRRYNAGYFWGLFACGVS